MLLFNLFLNIRRNVGRSSIGFPDLRHPRHFTQNKRSVLKFAIMTVMLELEPEIEMTASEQAREKGLPLPLYVASVVKEAVLKRQRVEKLSEKSFDEILKPFRDEVEASGMSEDELDELFAQTRREVLEEKRGK